VLDEPNYLASRLRRAIGRAVFAAGARAAALVYLDDETLLAEPGVRTAIAVSLFKDDALPLGRAAGMAGMALGEFVRHLFRLGFPIVKGDARSPREDRDDLDGCIACSARCR